MLPIGNWQMSHLSSAILPRPGGVYRQQCHRLHVNLGAREPRETG